MAEIVVKNRNLNTHKLISFGFEKEEDKYTYSKAIVNDQMILDITVSEGRMYSKITDSHNNDEYVLHLVESASGAFVGRVRSEYGAVIDEIIEKCTDPDVFKTVQAGAVTDYVYEKYGDIPEYLWEKFPDNAVVRRSDNKKWYLALLTVSANKLGLDSEERLEIIDLRMNPDELFNTVDGEKYFPGYHMNKKHWVTIVLDGRVPTEEILARVDASYILAKK